MEPGYPFDLNAALARWRRGLAENGTLHRDELDELEAHLLDIVDAQSVAGAAPREAFEAAIWQLGHASLLESEFRKAHAADAFARPTRPLQPLLAMSMLHNYLKIALRSLRRHPGYASINVFGLSLGMACCVLLFLYVRDELTYDRFHEHADRIHRVHAIHFTPGGDIEQRDPYLPMPLGPALQADLPEVERFVRFTQRSHLIRPGTEAAVEQEILYADHDLFEVFTFPLLAGDPATALVDPGSVVLSEKAARRLFGSENPLGQRLAIRLNKTFKDFTVSAVAEDPPGNSSIRFDVVLPFMTIVETMGPRLRGVDSWNWSSIITYVLLKSPASVQAMSAKLPGFWRKYHPSVAEEMRAAGRWSGEGQPTSYGLQPLLETHLDPGIPDGLVPASDPVYSYLLGGIALGVLAIGCINFMTLAIGRSARRAREIGVRKVVGAHRRQLMAQFWSEALLMSILACGLGVLIALAFLPTFNDLAGKSLRFDLQASVATAVVTIALALFTGLVAGSYPALLLSSLSPVETLKNRYRLGGSNVFTHALVVVQFALSVFLMASTLVMLDQLDYVRSKPLGFDREEVVVVRTSGLDGWRLLEPFRTTLEGRSGVVGVTAINHSFSRGLSVVGFDYRKGDATEPKGAVVYNVAPGFIELMDLDIVSGRAFDADLATDSVQAVLVNEALVRDFGWTNPVGEVLGGFTDDPVDDPVVIGVVRDFHFGSLHEEVRPMILTMSHARSMNALLVKLAPVGMPASLEHLRAAWQKMAPDLPFDYSFLDADLDRQYEADERWSRIVAYAAAFAIVIACMGLFGLAALSVGGRTKEIGVRKVLGASVTRLTGLLSWQFALLVVIAIVLALPVAYLVMSRWLETFAYRTEISPWLLATAGTCALCIALVTVSYQTLRAAQTDPVKALRYE